jgi:hypothetical protein
MLPLTVMRPTMMRNNAFGNDNRKGNDDEDEASSSSHDEEHASASPEKEDEPVIAKKETSTVVVLKLVVALVLVVSTIGAAIGIYRYARANEQQKFEAHFKTDSKKVLEAIASSFQKTLIAFDSLSATLVSYAESSNSTWPYVTIPHFAVRAAKMLSNSNLLYVSVLPLVKPQDRVAWEDYSMINDYWVNETMDLQAEWSGYYGPVETNWTAGPTSDGFNVLPYNLRYVACRMSTSFETIEANLISDRTKQPRLSSNLADVPVSSSGKRLQL